MDAQTLPIDEVAAAEAEVSRQEASLDERIACAKVLRREVSDKLARARQTAEDPALVAVLARLDVPPIALRTPLDEARLARLKAVAVRKSCVDSARDEIEGQLSRLDALLQRVREEQSAAKQRAVQRSSEAEAARSAERQAAAQRAPAKASAPQPSAGEDTLAAALQRAAVDHSHVGPQRRANPRARLCTEISVGSDSNLFTGFTGDVSEGGVFVATIELLPIGTQLDFAFTLPGGHHVEGRGEVRWVREIDDKSPEVFPGMGIRFLELPGPSLSAIKSFTQHREPMFFPES